MLRYTNHGTKLLEPRLFKDKGKIWDSSLNMNKKLADDFGLTSAKPTYVDYLETSIMFTTPRPTSNKAMHVKPCFPSLDNHNYLSDRQKALFAHIQADTLFLDTYELEVAVLRPAFTSFEDPLVTRRILAEGDPAHLSQRAQFGQLKCWANTNAVSRDRFSAPIGKPQIGLPVGHSVANRPWQRLKLCQIMYHNQVEQGQAKMGFYRVPDYIEGKKIDPIVRKFKDFQGSLEEKQRLEAIFKRDQDIGGDSELDLKVSWRNGDPVAIPVNPDMARNIREFTRTDDVFDLVPIHSTEKVAYFSGRNLEDFDNKQPNQVGFWAANVNKLLRVKDCLSDTEEHLANLNLENSRVLGPASDLSFVESDVPKAKINGQSYYSPVNFFPALSREDNFFARPSNTLQLWDRLIRDDDISDISDGNPAR